MSAYVYQKTPEVLEALRLAAEEADGGVIGVEMLWLGGLQTDCGGQLLEELGVRLGPIRSLVLRREGPPGYDGAADDALTMASRMTHMTDPGPDCCEQLICREVTQAPYEGFTFTDCSVVVDSTTGLVRSIHGPELTQDAVPVLRKGDSWIQSEEVLGVRVRSPLCKGPPHGVSALVASGRVGFLFLSNIPYEDPPAPDGAQE